MKLRIAFHDSSVPSANGSIYDRLIRWRTGSPLVHSELVIPGGSDDRHATCFSSVPGPGVRYDVIDITQPSWKLAEVEVNATPREVVLAANRYLGQKYDWLGILTLAPPLGVRLHDCGDKFCSELCVRVLQDLGAFQGEHAWCVSPGGLYRLIERENALAAWNALAAQVN